MSRWCLEAVGISKHLVWCCIFGKCQNLGRSNEMYYAATKQFSKNVQFLHWNYHKFIFTNEQMLFGGCRNFKTSSLVWYFWKMSKFRWKRWNVLCIYNFLKMFNLCIAITTLFLPMSRWCLEVVGISKHLFWCHIFGKCQIKVDKQWNVLCSHYTIF